MLPNYLQYITPYSILQLVCKLQQKRCSCSVAGLNLTPKVEAHIPFGSNQVHVPMLNLSFYQSRNLLDGSPKKKKKNSWIYLYILNNIKKNQDPVIYISHSAVSTVVIAKNTNKKQYWIKNSDCTNTGYLEYKKSSSFLEPYKKNPVF